MLKKLNKLLFILIIIILILSLIKLDKKNLNTIDNINLGFNIIKKQDSPIAKLTIKKLNLEEYLYDINSNENTIEKHITFLKESIFPNEQNSIVFIAAHSGTGKIAYFQELDKLEINDKIQLLYNGKKYNYYVKEIWEEDKNGYINVNKDLENQLILTTCSPSKKNKQLIINCIEKESN